MTGTRFLVVEWAVFIVFIVIAHALAAAGMVNAVGWALIAVAFAAVIFGLVWLWLTPTEHDTNQHIVLHATAMVYLALLAHGVSTATLTGTSAALLALVGGSFIVVLSFVLAELRGDRPLNVAIIVIVMLLGAGLITDSISAERAAIVGLAGIAAVAVLSRLLASLDGGKSVGVESSWGGLGGGLGGWGISPPAVLIVILLAVLGVAAGFLMQPTAPSGIQGVGATPPPTSGKGG